MPGAQSRVPFFSDASACGGILPGLQLRSSHLTRHTAEFSGHNFLLPSPPVAGDKRCTHFTAAAPEASPAVILSFSGARVLMRGTGTTCHCRPHKAPVGLQVSLVSPQTCQIDLMAVSTPAVYKERLQPLPTSSLFTDRVFEVSSKSPTTTQQIGSLPSHPGAHLQRTGSQFPPYLQM